MIVIIAVLAILLLIACVGLHVLNGGVKESHDVAIDNQEKWIKEIATSAKLRAEVEALKAELAERPLPVQPEEEPEQGNFVRKRKLKRATPETYRNAFDLDSNGRRALDHLQLKYAEKSTYVRGGHDAERESCFRAGQVDVISFIFKQINIANDPSYDPKKYEEEVND